MPNSHNSRHTWQVRRLPAWRAIAFLAGGVLVAVIALWWFLFKAAATERITARQHTAETYRARLQGAKSRLLSQWEDHLRQVNLQSNGLPPAAAFACVVANGLADTVIIRDHVGQIAYPTVASRPVPPDHSGRREALDAVQATVSELRQALSDERWDDALRSAALLEDSIYDGVVDQHGRVVALNGSWLFLESFPDKASREYHARTKQLRERLTDYANDAILASQRRFLMHAMRSACDIPSFPTLDAEDIAAELILSQQPTASGSQDGILWPLQDKLWAVQTKNSEMTLILKESSLHGLLQRELDADFSVTVPRHSGLAGNVSASFSTQMGATMPGWEIRARTPADPAAIERNTKLYIWIGALATMAMIMFAWTVSRGMIREARRAQLKQDLASAISHELRTPLSSMRVLVDLLLEDEVLDQSKTREYLHLMAKENARLTQLVENFLTFSRIERRREPRRAREKIDLVELLAETGATAREAFAGDRLEVDVEPGLPAVRGDRVSLHSAVMNLLDNACKYSPQDRSFTLRGFQKNGDVRIEVRDHGPGLRSNEITHAFKAFDRLTNGNTMHPTGCGLGLYIVQTVVEDAGGRVEIDSRPGSGSTFRIVLPAMTTNGEEAHATRN